ncbi:DUF3105 domain-containing protein [Nocardia cyriacigeorgica]|uniref:DUF3105 domain-containing protein n=1 Tax=Nocardia cyriacigeorgica TaxID=135487 RepID=A0A5R8PE77_9NOCA|nr:DUF3105 domain-containing protein [Nocardia cyriacigeorgica]TLG08827.1 DUF3105 domain-containing protein [Nocardia cyriacigeorgica]
MPSRTGGRRNRRRSGARAIQGAKQRNRVSWPAIAGVAVVLGLIAVLAVDLIPDYRRSAQQVRFTPGADNPDPSVNIDGVLRVDYPPGQHVRSPQRVAYDNTPPLGGPHDQYWATCTGIVYSEPLRPEHAVHSLEHGAVWITYSPERLSSKEIEELSDQVAGQQYMMMSPHPALPAPIVLQSWGRQLRVDSVDDERIGRFVTALRQNPNTHPEPGASCSTIPGGFDPDRPPPAEVAPPGPDAVPVKPAADTPRGGDGAN